MTARREDSMRIVIINDYSQVQGGATQVAVASARGLAMAGHDVIFVYGVGPVSEQLEHPNISLVGLDQHDLLTNPSRIDAAIKGIWNHQVYRKVARLLSSLDSANTLVHIHTWVKSLSASVVTASVKSGLPVAVTLHDYFSVCPNGGLYNYQKNAPCPLKPMSAACLATNCDARSYPQKLWRYLRQGVAERVGVPGQISHFIFVSTFSRHILAPKLPEGARRWQVANPIDIDKQARAKPSEHQVFTFAGRLAQEKGVLTLAEAAKQLSPCPVRMVGAGELQSRLEALLPEAEFTGWVQHGRVNAHIARSRALIFPSRWYETQGMTVSEAAALGVPCIVSDACAGRDSVEHGVTGLWFKSGDAAALAEAMQTLRDDPALADTLGGNAYRRYWDCPPDLSEHVTQLEATYGAILAEAHGSVPPEI